MNNHKEQLQIRHWSNITQKIFKAEKCVDAFNEILKLLCILICVPQILDKIFMFVTSVELIIFFHHSTAFYPNTCFFPKM